MDFELTEELKMLKERAYKFAVAEFSKVSHECDEKEMYTPEIRKKGAENGFVGAWIPKEYGGAGAGFFGHTVITEEMARVDMGLQFNVTWAPFGCEAIYHDGTEEQKKTYFPPVCRGDQVCAGAYTEPNSGTDVAAATTTAVKDGDYYVINGDKMFISNGTVCSFMVAQCVTNPEEKKHNSFSLIIVPADAPGITRNEVRGKLGIRATNNAKIFFKDVRVPRTNLVGREGNGFRQLMHFFDTTRVAVAGQGLGLSEACLETSIKYVKERMVFGAPLGSFQITQMKLTEMAVRVEALRGLVYKAAYLMDQGRPDYVLASMAKYFGGQTAVFCANYAVELHGGYGYIDEYAVQKWYRDAKILELYEGTKEAEIITVGRMLQAR